MDLTVSIFATYNPSWANIQALFNILLTGNKMKLVNDKAGGGAHQLHREDPAHVPLVKPSWDRQGIALAQVLSKMYYKRGSAEGSPNRRA